MGDIVFNIDVSTGAAAVGGLEEADQAGTARDARGPGRALYCARPGIEMLVRLPVGADRPDPGILRVNAVYHGSLVEGYGVVSSVRLQGCSIRCTACIVPETHPFAGGRLLPVWRVADLLMDPAYRRDGVSILGGEPFDQPDGVAGLVALVGDRGLPITVYSGYTVETLLRRAMRKPSVRRILGAIDLLIDGPFVKGEADGAGAYRGSRNQRLWTRAQLHEALAGLDRP